MLATPRTTRPKPTQAIGWGQVLTPQSWQRSGVLVGGEQRNTDALSLLVSTSSVHPGKVSTRTSGDALPIPSDHSTDAGCRVVEQG